MSTRPRSILLALTWYDHRIHAGVARFALEQGWILDARMANSKEQLTDWRGDGVICKLGCSTPDTSLIDFVRTLRLPLVDMSFFGGDLRQHIMVEFDNADVARISMAHFINSGIRHFAFFPVTPARSVADRRNHFALALKQAGHVLHHLMPGRGHWHVAEAHLGRQLLALPRPAGVLCFNDNYAVKLLHAAASVGLRVPDDLAILGIDNQTLVCENLPIPLSSVVTDMEAQGYRAAKELQQLLDGRPPVNRSILLAASGIAIRRSTDRVASEHAGVTAAVRYIFEHFRQPMPVAAVAKACNMARSSLKRAFQNELGRSVSDEIERIRTQEACRLLTETNLKLAIVAKRAGFGNERRLLRSFRSRMATTPHAYRKARTTGRSG